MPASDFLDEELSMCSSHDTLSLKWKKKKKGRLEKYGFGVKSQVLLPFIAK